MQQVFELGVDGSPVATAERIVAMSANFFSSYPNLPTDMDYQTHVESFVELISGCIDQGFSDARESLDGLQVLQGDIAENIDTTYDLVQEKLAALTETLLNSGNKSEDSSEPQT